MIKAHVDGLQVLKGGQGKATVYFSKDAMHGALDLNETNVIISREQAQIQTPSDAVLSNIADRLERLLAEINAMREPVQNASDCHHKTDACIEAPCTGCEVEV